MSAVLGTAIHESAERQVVESRRASLATCKSTRDITRISLLYAHAVRRLITFQGVGMEGARATRRDLNTSARRASQATGVICH